MHRALGTIVTTVSIVEYSSVKRGSDSSKNKPRRSGIAGNGKKFNALWRIMYEERRQKVKNLRYYQQNNKLLNL